MLTFVERIISRRLKNRVLLTTVSKTSLLLNELFFRVPIKLGRNTEVGLKFLTATTLMDSQKYTSLLNVAPKYFLMLQKCLRKFLKSKIFVLNLS